MRQLLQVYDDAYHGVDLGAIDYDQGVHAKHRLTRYHDFFVERVHEGERVLDVGCGKGELAYDLAERSGAHVVAVDASPWMLEFARERFAHPNVTFVQADAVEFTPDEPVDVAVCRTSSSTSNRAWSSYARCGSAPVRDACSFACLRCERDWTVPLRHEVGLPHFSDPEHKLEYDPQLLRAELAEAGWEMGEPQLNWGEIWVEASAR